MKIKFIGAASLFAQATQTLTGKVSDATYGAHHMIKVATGAQCTRECISVDSISSSK